MKLILFLGSGVSFESGLPSTETLKAEILHAPFHADQSRAFKRDERRLFFPGARVNTELDFHFAVDQIRIFLSALDRHSEQDRKRGGVGRSRDGFVEFGSAFRSGTTYEDLFALCQLIDQWSGGENDDAAATAFVDLLCGDLAGVLEGDNPLARAFSLGKFAQAAMDLIRCVIVAKLDRPAVIKGLNLILDLASSPAITQLNIVTLNHDTLVERLLNAAGVPLVDGFGALDGAVRWYDESTYDDVSARVRLFKLHGSVDWHDFLKGGAAVPGVVVHGTAATASNASGTPLRRVGRFPRILVGGRKEAWYQHGQYADIHYRFHEVLRHCDRIVMSGYGWGDTGITNQIERWFDQHSSNRLVLLEKNVQANLDRSSTMSRSYSSLADKGQFLTLPNYLSHISHSEIQDALN